MLPRDIKSITLQGSPSDVKKSPLNNKIYKNKKNNSIPTRNKLKNDPEFRKATKAMVYEVLCELLN